LHSSQEIIIDNDSELVIKLKIFITYDFVMEILSYGYNVKVLKPPSLVDSIKKNYENTLSKY